MKYNSIDIGLNNYTQIYLLTCLPAYLPTISYWECIFIFFKYILSTRVKTNNYLVGVADLSPVNSNISTLTHTLRKFASYYKLHTNTASFIQMHTPMAATPKHTARLLDTADKSVKRFIFYPLY